MKMKFFVLFMMVSQQFLLAVGQVELDIINQYPTTQILTVDEGRNLVNQLWQKSFSSKSQATSVQKLVFGFQTLVQGLKDDKQSIAEQAYLMWLSGRTHGFNAQGNQTDVQAQNNLRNHIANGVAKRLVQKETNLTANSIDYMLKESERNTQNTELALFTKKQDDNLLASITSCFSTFWLSHQGIDNAETAKQIREKSKPSSRSLDAIVQAHQKIYQDILSPTAKDMAKQVLDMRQALSKLAEQRKKEEEAIKRIQQQAQAEATNRRQEIENHALSKKSMEENLARLTKKIEMDTKNLTSITQKVEEEKRNKAKTEHEHQEACKQLNKIQKEIEGANLREQQLQTIIADLETDKQRIEGECNTIQSRLSVTRLEQIEKKRSLVNLREEEANIKKNIADLQTGKQRAESEYKNIQQQLAQAKQNQQLIAHTSTPQAIASSSTLNLLTIIAKLSQSEWNDIVAARKQYEDRQILSPAEQSLQIFKSQPAIGTMTGTDAFMKHSLGFSYIDPRQSNSLTTDHANQSFSQRADIANMLNFLKNQQAPHNSPVQTEFKKAKAQSPTEWSLYVRTLLECFETERQYPGCYFAYHTVPASLAFCNKVATKVKELLNDRKHNVHASRGCDKLFGDAKDIDQLIEVWGWSTKQMTHVDNYAHKKPVHIETRKEITSQAQSASNVLLSVNPFLTGNRDCDSSCTYSMYLKNDSIRPPNYKEIIVSIFDESNIKTIDEETFTNLNKLHDQFVKMIGGNILWQICMTPEVANKTMYLSKALGVGIDASIDNCRPDHLKLFRENCSWRPTTNLRDLQARIGLIPKITEGTGYHIFHKNKSQATEKEWEAFESEFTYTIYDFLSRSKAIT